MQASSEYTNLLICIGPLGSCSLLNHSQTGYNDHADNPVRWQTVCNELSGSDLYCNGL